MLRYLTELKLRIKSIKHYVYNHLENNIEKEGNIIITEKIRLYLNSIVTKTKFIIKK